MLRPTLWTALTITQSLLLAHSQSCLPGYEWANNREGQSVCEIMQLAPFVAHFDAPHVDAVFIPPSIENQNPGLCSVVYWLLVSSCAAYSGHHYDSWSTWSENCRTTAINLSPIDDRDLMPQWLIDHSSYLIRRGEYDPDIANDSPQRRATMPHSGTSEAAGRSSAGSATSVSATSLSVNPTDARLTNTSRVGPSPSITLLGIILLSALGGIVLLLLICLPICFCRRRRLRKRHLDHTVDQPFVITSRAGRQQGTVSTMPTAVHKVHAGRVSPAPVPIQHPAARNKHRPVSEDHVLASDTAHNPGGTTLTPTLPSNVIFHEDSGVRIPAEGPGGTLEFPPMYTAT